MGDGADVAEGPKGGTTCRRFLFGLRVASQLPLPGFAAAPPGEVDVTVAIGPVPALGQSLAVPDADTLQLEIEGVGRYRILRGREIVIDPAAGASERNLRVFLLGSAFGALLHQRGMLPLHANAVEISGRAIAFVGRSGAGKSTLAAWFHDRGYKVLCDDVCAVAMNADGRPLAFPGVPRLRLWRDALERSGREPGRHELSFDGQDKFDLLTGAEPDARPRLLAACYVLADPDTAAAPGIEPLDRIDALEALTAHTYRGGFARRMGGARNHLDLCLKLVASVPVHCVTRRWDTARFDEEAWLLEKHAVAAVAAD